MRMSCPFIQSIRYELSTELIIKGQKTTGTPSHRPRNRHHLVLEVQQLVVGWGWHNSWWCPLLAYSLSLEAIRGGERGAAGYWKGEGGEIGSERRCRSGWRARRRMIVQEGRRAHGSPPRLADETKGALRAKYTENCKTHLLGAMLIYFSPKTYSSTAEHQYIFPNISKQTMST
jgi:hypothetical protein